MLMSSRCCVWEIQTHTPFTFKIVAFFSSSKDLALLSWWIDLQWLLCWYQKSHYHPPSCISYTLGNSRWRLVCTKKKNLSRLNTYRKGIRTYFQSQKIWRTTKSSQLQWIFCLILAHCTDQWGTHFFLSQTRGFG